MLILSFSIFISIIYFLAGWLVLLFIFALFIRLLVAPLRFVYNSLFGIINEV